MLVSINAATVVAEVQMAVEPAVGGDIRRDVPTSTAKLADEDAPATGATPQSGRTAHDDVLLMAVDDLGAAESREQPDDGTDWCAGPARTKGCQARAPRVIPRSRVDCARRTSRAWSVRAWPCGAPARTHSARLLRRSRRARRAPERCGRPSSRLEHLEPEGHEPRWEHPGPATLVDVRPAIRAPPDQLVDQRRMKVDLRRGTAEPRVTVMRELVWRRRMNRGTDRSCAIRTSDDASRR